jgi:hypothetical protein
LLSLGIDHSPFWRLALCIQLQKHMVCHMHRLSSNIHQIHCTLQQLQNQPAFQFICEEIRRILLGDSHLIKMCNVWELFHRIYGVLLCYKTLRSRVSIQVVEFDSLKAFGSTLIDPWLYNSHDYISFSAVLISNMS